MRRFLPGRAADGGHAMQSVAIRTGRGIGIARHHRPAVPRKRVVFGIVAADAFFLNGYLFRFSGFRDRVNFLMTVRAGHVLRHGMDVRLIGRSNLPVAVGTADRIGFLLARTVARDVFNSRMAAGAGIIAVNGSGKTADQSPIRMAGLAFRGPRFCSRVARGPKKAKSKNQNPCVA